MIDSATLQSRRDAVTSSLEGRRAWIFAGRSAERNFAHNTYPFRASSHFLFLVGAAVEGAVLELDGSEATLFIPDALPEDRLWHGEPRDSDELAHETGLRVRPLSALSSADDILTLPVAQGPARTEQLRLLGRVCDSRRDEALFQSMVAARLCHDKAGVDALLEAASATVAAHAKGMQTTRSGLFEWQVRSAMQGEVMARGCTTAYQPIVTTMGHVLHQHAADQTLCDGELLLVDFGAEAPSGYACDVTRTWPVAGRFSGLQSDLYEVVLAAQRAALLALRPTVRFREIHQIASRVLCQGLVDFGLLRGDSEELVSLGVHALFFPHGVGHLIGLDVHDMEDLGDVAGYPAERQRASQFGLSYLRLDRDLEVGMAVTIEPGFYCVPAILDDPARADLISTHVDANRLALVRSEVRGVRIEDVAIISEDGSQVVSEAIPKSVAAIEQAVLGEDG